MEHSLKSNFVEKFKAIASIVHIVMIQIFFEQKKISHKIQ